MTELEMFFNREMEFARHMVRLDRREYWYGYSLGLLRGFIGASAVQEDRHSAMLTNGSVDDDARGYVEAFRAIELLRASMAVAADPEAPRRPQEISRT